MAEILRRYTDVLSLLDILRHNRLTLLSPSRWFDQTDALGLSQYGTRKGEGSVYALCLAQGKERSHHWQLFSGHNHGLCIQFDKREFVDLLNSRDDIVHGPVIYQSLEQVRQRNVIDSDVLPFLKRDAFKAEEEYRIVAWVDELVAGLTYEVPMPASMIKRVTLGPTVPHKLATTLKDIAREQEGCDKIPFSLSRLVSNESWNAVIAGGLFADQPGTRSNL